MTAQCRTRHCAKGALFFLWFAATSPAAPVNDAGSDRTLIVLAAPSATDPYYRKLRKEILDFQTAFARQIIGRDNVVILADKRTVKELSATLPDDVLLEAPMEDIWMRDFAPVRPEHPVLFRYSAAAQSGKPEDADHVQAAFVRFAQHHNLSFEQAPWILDGGNVVDNGIDKAIVTDRFLSDNHLDKEQALQILRDQLGVENIAILPADPEDRLAHADGMVLFTDSNTVAITRYGGEFQKSLERELQSAFPAVRIVEIESTFDDNAFDPNFGSAKGIYVNATVTGNAIYLPLYGLETDGPALAKIRASTPLDVIPIDAGKIGQMGGSVRCLSTQMKGENARRLIEAARIE